jgi:hypothetical protein
VSIRIRATSILLAAAVALGLTVAGASSAAAIPGLPDCKEAPVVYSPSDTSLTQWLDPRADGATVGGAFDTAPPSIYSHYGYAGFQWSTYDLGCAGALSSFDSLQATADTATGSKLLGLATAQVALTNGVHARLGNLSAFMAPLDDVVSDTTSSLREAVYRPWIGGALAVVVVVMLAMASVGQLSQTLRAGAWALAVLTVTMGVLNFPIRAAQFFDTTVASSVDAVNAAAAGLGTLDAKDGEVAPAQNALLVDRVLYDSWVRGLFGTTSGAAVEKYARPLWEAHTLTYDEEKTYRAGGEAAKTLIERKNDRWTQTMAQIADDDPSLYQQVQGKKGGRVGVGAMTLASTSAVGLFRMVADLYTLLGMVVIRLLVMFAPLIGVLGVVVTFGGVVRWAGNMLGAAVINTIGFSLGAVVHTVATNALVNGSNGGMEFGRLLLAALLTLGLFFICWPLLSLRRIAGRDHRPGAGLLTKGGRLARSYVTTRSATAAGLREAVDEGSPDPRNEQGYRWSRRDFTSDTVRPEAHSRPQLLMRAPATTGAVRAADVETREVTRRRESARGLYFPDDRGPAGNGRQVLHGRVVEAGEDPFSRRSVHESNRHNGDLPGVVYVYDPASGEDVPLPGLAPAPGGGRQAAGAVR